MVLTATIRTDASLASIDEITSISGGSAWCQQNGIGAYYYYLILCMAGATQKIDAARALLKTFGRNDRLARSGRAFQLSL
jgi:hypothetical protein